MNLSATEMQTSKSEVRTCTPPPIQPSLVHCALHPPSVSAGGPRFDWPRFGGRESNVLSVRESQMKFGGMVKAPAPGSRISGVRCRGGAKTPSGAEIWHHALDAAAMTRDSSFSVIALASRVCSMINSEVDWHEVFGAANRISRLQRRRSSL